MEKPIQECSIAIWGVTRLDFCQTLPSMLYPSASTAISGLEIYTPKGIRAPSDSFEGVQIHRAASLLLLATSLDVLVTDVLPLTLLLGC